MVVLLNDQIKSTLLQNPTRHATIDTCPQLRHTGNVLRHESLGQTVPIKCGCLHDHYCELIRYSGQLI